MNRKKLFLMLIFCIFLAISCTSDNKYSGGGSIKVTPNDEQIIVSHLHMVRLYLKSCEQCRDNETRKVTPTISQDDTSYHWWEISQRHNLP